MSIVDRSDPNWKNIEILRSNSQFKQLGYKVVVDICTSSVLTKNLARNTAITIIIIIIIS